MLSERQKQLDLQKEELVREKSQIADWLADIERREQALGGAGESRSSAPGGQPHADAERFSSHAAVADFWDQFDSARINRHAAAGAGMDTAPSGLRSGSIEFGGAGHRRAGHAEDQSIDPSGKPVSEPPAAEGPIVEEQSQSAALRRALEAARAEMAAAESEAAPSLSPEARMKLEEDARRAAEAIAPVKFTSEMAARTARTTGVGKSDKTSKPAAAKKAVTRRKTVTAAPQIELDPETANKLKTLRRLNPTKSEAELLAQIESEKAKTSTVKAKKGWFSRK